MEAEEIGMSRVGKKIQLNMSSKKVYFLLYTVLFAGMALCVFWPFLENDKSYLTRVVSAFGARYSDRLEIYSFTDQAVAFGSLNSAKIDVLLSSDSFDIDISKLPNRCAFAYLVDSAGIDLLNDFRDDISCLEIQIITELCL